MSIKSSVHLPVVRRAALLTALLAGAFLPMGCATDHPTAPETPVAMKAGARGGHRGMTNGAANAAPPGQSGQTRQ